MLNNELPNEFDVPKRDDQEVFAEALEKIAAVESLRDEHYTQLSHLAGTRLEQFQEIWKALPEPKRLDLLNRMRAREENDLRLEFNSVYHIAIEDESPRLRLGGIASIVEDKSGWLLGRLMNILERDPDTEVRAAAGRALGPFAQDSELGEWDEEESDELEALLVRIVRRVTEPLDVRGAALESAGYISQPDVASEIDDAFGEEELRISAIIAMGHSAEPRWLSRLLRYAEDDDPDMRRAVAKACGGIPDQTSVPVLVDMLDDADLGVRLAAISSLREHGGDEAREGLFYAVEDKNAQVREAATLAM